MIWTGDLDKGLCSVRVTNVESEDHYGEWKAVTFIGSYRFYDTVDVRESDSSDANCITLSFIQLFVPILLYLFK